MSLERPMMYAVSARVLLSEDKLDPIIRALDLAQTLWPGEDDESPLMRIAEECAGGLSSSATPQAAGRPEDAEDTRAKEPPPRAFLRPIDA